MLQRAASNAYSWWVAGHIRTKQSKWLEQSLQDMEEKVAAVMKLISEDGDSFAKRAEMYYKKRPELLNFVEDSFRAYRSLAERYDHLSKELQNANNTLASAFPDQFQFMMDDDEDDDMESSRMPRKGAYNQKHSTNVPSIPKQFPTRNIKAIMALASKTNSNNNNNSSGPKKGGRRPGNKAVEALRSGYDKAQAVQEIDKLQKSILTKQTEKEFTKSSYESGVTKYMEIEKEITEMQQKVSVLQEEFGVGKAIEDNEARTLMLESALKSCQNALAELQEKQAKADAELKLERERIHNTRDRILSFKGEFNLSGGDGDDDQTAKPLREERFANFDDDARTARQAKEIEMFRDRMKEHFEGNSCLSMSDMVEKIDELVNKVISMDSGVTSQTAMIHRMKVESDELQTHIQSLEDDKTNLIDGKNILTDKLKEMEQKLKGIQDLDHRVETRNTGLQTQFIEASSNIQVISRKLPHLKLDEVENEEKQGDQEEVVAAKNDRHTKATLHDTEHVESKSSDHQGKSHHSVKFIEPRDSSEHPIVDGGSIIQQEYTISEQLKEPISDSQADKVQMGKQGKDERNWEKKYTSVLHDYKEVQKKLEEVENKSEDSLTELRELENAIAKKDEEIRCLQQKLVLLQKKTEEEYRTMKENNGCPLEHVHDKDEITIKSIQIEEESELRNLKNVIAKKDEEIQSLQKKLILMQNKLEEYKSMKETNGCPLEHVHHKDNIIIELIQVGEEREMSAAEAKLRADIDEILEENLDFWIRFSSSFAEIQKFQSQVGDLHKDLERIDQHKKKREVSDESGPSLKSDSRAIYKHLKEIQTELTVWLQQSMGLRDELQRRFTQLCNIQEQITEALNDGAVDEQMRFTSLQAAKFQGEVLNMQQENNRVADELQASLDNVTTLQIHIEKTVDRLNEELGMCGSKSQSSPQHKQTGTRNQVPLRSFIFGVKQKKQKQSFFSCVHPAFHKRS